MNGIRRFPLCFLLTLLLFACAPAIGAPANAPTSAAAPVRPTAVPLTPAQPAPAPTAVPPTPAQPAPAPTAVLPPLAVAPPPPTAGPLPERPELTFSLVAQLGGTFDPVAVDGRTAYLGIGPRFATVDVADLAAPRLLWQSDPLPDRVGAIAVQSGRAYLRAGANLLIYDTADPARPALLGALSGISGDLFPAGNVVYARAAAPAGDANPPLLAVDVRDPRRPVLAGSRQLSGPTGIAVSGALLYLASGAPFDSAGEAALQLVDRSDLARTLSEMPLPGDWGHRVAADGNWLYVVEDRLSAEADLLLVLDVSDPAHPREVAAHPMQIDHSISQVVAAGDTLFLLARAFPHTGCPTLLLALDVTDPASPRDLAEFDPQSCLNNLALAAEGLVATSDRGLQTFRFTAPAGLALSGGLPPPDGFFAVERIGLSQDLAFLLTTAGRNRLHQLQALDLAGGAPALLPGAGLALAIEPSIYEGLDVRGSRVFGLGPEAVDVADPAAPRLLSDELSGGNAAGVYYWPSPARVGDLLYTSWFTPTADGGALNGIGVLDLGAAGGPALVGTLPLGDASLMGLSTADGYLVAFSQRVAAQTVDATLFSTSLSLYDLHNPRQPVEVGRPEPAVDVPGQVWDFAAAGSVIYAASMRIQETNVYQLLALDISDPAQPVELGRFDLPDMVTKLVVVGDRLWMRLASGELWVLAVGDRAHPAVVGRWQGPILDFDMAGDRLYLAAGDAGLLIVQLGG